MKIDAARGRTMSKAFWQPGQVTAMVLAWPPASVEYSTTKAAPQATHTTRSSKKDPSTAPQEDTPKHTARSHGRHRRGAARVPRCTPSSNPRRAVGYFVQYLMFRQRLSMRELMPLWP
jgi:hypothetical protein